MTRTISLKQALAIGIVAVAALFGYAIFAHAQDGGDDAELRGITFPIPELGNCGSKDECKTYCSDAAHIDACVNFAKAHGLMNNDEASRALKFKKRLLEGGGPGGCTTPDSCRAFCEKLENIEGCVRFAEEHGADPNGIAQGRKVAAYIKSGGTLPGGCTSREACETYCHDFTHAEECSAFAAKIGVSSLAPGQIERFLALLKNGETPGKCQSKDACEAYCRNQSNKDECTAFAEKAGFINRGQAEKIKALGGRGPGGCDSPESCRAYCADQTHHDECYKFAEEHGFLKKEDVDRAKEGFVRLRAGLEQAPPEVAECLKATLGQNIIEDIGSGNLTPGPEIGERVKACFEKFGRRSDPTEVFKNVPADVAACLKEKLGAEFGRLQTGAAEPTAGMADAARVCFQNVRLLKPNAASPYEGFSSFLRSAPPAIAACLKEKLGAEFERFASGEIQPPPDIKERLRSCFETFRPEGVPVPPSPESAVCPKMPTIESCPAGSRRVVVFSSPACGTYYGCKPEDGNTSGGGTVCIQVITPAQDPVTGACKQFPTPCDVPIGWIKGCTQSIETPTYTYPQTTPYNYGFCADYDSCKRVCFDASNIYYRYAECEKFRTSVGQ